DLAQEMDPEDTLDALSCESLQDAPTLDPTERWTRLQAALAAADDEAARAGIESTMRLLQESALVETAASALVGSELSVPACGVHGWMLESGSCSAEAPPAALAATNNCARLLSEHVPVALLTVEVPQQCFAELRAVSRHAGYDEACGDAARQDVARFA